MEKIKKDILSNKKTRFFDSDYFVIGYNRFDLCLVDCLNSGRTKGNNEESSY